MKKFIVILFIVIFMILISSVLFAGVTIVRKVPKVEENIVEAQWRKAPSIEEKKIKTTITGKIELGGTGGSDVNGSSILNVYTDSSVNLSRPMQFATLNINAGAYRKSYLQGSDDKYSVGLGLSSDLWSVDVVAKYGFFNKNEKDENNTDIKKSGNDLYLGFNASSSFIQVMPMSLSFNHEEKKQDEDKAETENILENNLNINSNGSFGNLSIDFSGTLDNKDDIAKNMLMRQYGANIKVGYKVSEPLNIYSYINPSYSVTSYSDTNSDIKSTILDYGLGAFMPFSDNLQVSTKLGRVDSWTNSNEGGNPIWKADATLMYNPIEAISLNSTYNFNKVVSGNLQNKINLDVLFSGEENSLIQSAGLGGGFDYISDDSGDKVSSSAVWKGNIDFLPTIDITIETSYNGGYSEKYDSSLSKMSSLWNHQFAIEMKHEVLETLSYNVSAKLSGYLPEYLAKQIKQEYYASITYAPPIGWRTLVLNSSENFNITNTDSSRDLSSQFSVGSSIQATKYIYSHYNFGWSWINLSTSGPFNNFSHNIGFQINGKEKAMSLGMDYTIKHGSSGLSHLVESNFYYPFTNNLGMRAWMSLNIYKENGLQKSPFTIGVSSVYMF